MRGNVARREDRILGFRWRNQEKEVENLGEAVDLD